MATIAAVAVVWPRGVQPEVSRPQAAENGVGSRRREAGQLVNCVDRGQVDAQAAGRYRTP